MILSGRSENKKLLFAPGCALMLYKPELADKIYRLLIKNLGSLEMLLTCCQHEPDLPANSKIINVCPGCDKRFGNNYEGITTISLWEILADSDFFNFPDYHGEIMSINDACPVRGKEIIHHSIRKLLLKMNIILVEPKSSRTKSICCGDTFYGLIPTENVMELMIKRASQMPLDDVVVYCVSCIKAVYNGGKKPQYLIDLLFNEDTVPKTHDPDEWHKELMAYIEEH